MSAHVDLRTFSYPLSALLEQRRRALERAQEEQSRADAQVSQASEALAALRGRMQAQHAHFLNSMQRPLQPEWHQQSLLYLTGQQNQLDALNTVMAQRQAHARELREQCLRIHTRIKALEEHRQALLDEHILEQQRRMAAEMDKAWTARTAWLATLRRAG